MAEKTALPLPLWLLAGEFLAAVLLVMGFMVHFSPQLARDAGVPPGAAVPMIVFGGLGLVGCAVAAVRHLLRKRATVPPLPH